MQYSRYRTTGYYASYFPPAVKWLLIVNVAIFVVEYFGRVLLEVDPFNAIGHLVPAQVLNGAIWQLVTYQFLHGGFGHILFNMLALWMFGMDLERDWGTKRFLQYYFLCGTGAGVCVIGASAVFGGMYQATIGSSGAIYGLLLAFGMLYPDRIVLMSFLFPIKAKYFVMIMGAIAFMSSFGAGSGVSHVAHLGGMIFGYIFLKTRLRRRVAVANPFARLGEQYRQWKIQRARRKFQVYLRKRGSDVDRDRWVH